MKYRSMMLAIMATVFVIALHFFGYTSMSVHSQNQPLESQKIVTQQANSTVKIHNFKFDPAILKIQVGQTVKFINSDDEPHTVTAKDGSFDSKALDTDQAWTYTFTKIGTIPYFCAVHPFMKGTLIVVSKGEKNAA